MAIVNAFVMIHMAVSDMDKMKDFYEGKLGCKVTKDQAYGDKRWVSLKFPGGGATINLTTVHEYMKPGTNKLFFSSKDVAAAQKELATKDIKSVTEGDDWGQWENPDGKGKHWFEVTDPDGNHILIIPA
jgi:catechol 2,3-dioxygenase-like lactoylglutathione lyase family enzyme